MDAVVRRAIIRLEWNANLKLWKWSIHGQLFLVIRQRMVHFKSLCSSKKQTNHHVMAAVFNNKS